jgi:D-alanyl-D-alanine dipeptidase
MGNSVKRWGFFFWIGGAMLCSGSRLVGAQPAPNPDAARQLVELVRVEPRIRLEVRYATNNNFMKRRLYPQARVFVHRQVAEALSRVADRCQRHGKGLLVFDGYRPWRITQAMWEATPVEKRAFVADPAKGSRHNRGGAVDLTLVDLKTGRAVEMTSAYDEFSPRAAANFRGTPRAVAHRDLLRRAMEAEGFQVYPEEWWHFDFKGWQSWPLLDYSFDELDRL